MPVDPSLWSLTAAPALRKAAASDIQTFESSLATIGRSALYAKAPAMAKHEIGFQVLDNDDDNSRAVGVFGFRVGRRLLYVPLFYRDGVVKGTEQLRDPRRKITVPLSDNWVNKFLSETKDDASGTRLPRTETRSLSQPSLWQLKYPPTKYAAEEIESDWVATVRTDIARAIGTRPLLPSADCDLVKYAEEHPALLVDLGRWLTAYPWFGDAVRRYHGVEKVASAVLAARSATTPPPAHPLAGTIMAAKTAAAPRTYSSPPRSLLARPAATKSAAAVTIIRVSAFRANAAPLHDAFDYSPTELDELKAGKNAYRDSRKDEDKTQVAVWLDPSGPMSISNPECSGLYQVISADGDLHDCAVFTPVIDWGRTPGSCLVYCLDSGAWCLTNRNAVWVKGHADFDRFSQWLREQPSPRELPRGENIVCAGIAGVRPGWATVPFSIASDGASVCTMWGGRLDEPYWAAGGYPRSEWARDETAPRRVSLLDTDGRPALSAHHLYLPKNTYVLKLGDKRFRPAMGTEPERLYLDRAVHRAKEAGAHVLSAQISDDRIAITDPRTEKSARFYHARDAEAHLVEVHGLAADTAEAFVARVQNRKTARALVKYAAPYASGMPTDWPNAPAMAFDQIPAPAGFAEDILPTETQSAIAQPINDLLMQPGDRDRYRPYPMEFGVSTPIAGIGNGTDALMNDRLSGGEEAEGPSESDLKTVSTASATGRRELFDTAALAALVKHTRLENLRRKVSGSMIKTVSGLADLLAHMYWNVEEWAEQLGQSEVGPLEDQTRGLFDGLGDLYLTLQEKAVSDGPDYGVLPAMGPASGADASI